MTVPKFRVGRAALRRTTKAARAVEELELRAMKTEAVQ
jgi:hypothetical protein